MDPSRVPGRPRRATELSKSTDAHMSRNLRTVKGEPRGKRVIKYHKTNEGPLDVSCSVKTSPRAQAPRRSDWYRVCRSIIALISVRFRTFCSRTTPSQGFPPVQGLIQGLLAPLPLEMRYNIQATCYNFRKSLRRLNRDIRHFFSGRR